MAIRLDVRRDMRIRLALIPISAVFILALFHQTDQDVHRYFAYCSAALGRPYTTFYVRPPEAWRQAFIAGTREYQKDFPLVSPSRRLTPYRDFLMEYPPGVFLAALPPALMTRDERRYTVLFEASMAALIVAAFWLCVPIARLLGTPVTARFAVLASISALALGKVPFQRYDPLVALLVVIMCWATLERRPVVLGLSVAMGIVVKVVPIFAAVICGMYLLRGRHRRQLIVAAIVAAAALAIVVIGCDEYIGLSHLAEMLRYHLNRPAEFESTAAALLGLWTGVEPRSAAISYAYGSINVVGTYDGIALAATNIVAAAGSLFVCLEAWRALGLDRRPADRARTLVVATTTGLAVIIGFGKVASAQYLVWLLPLGLLVTHAGDDDLALWLLLGTLTLSQIVFPLIPFVAAGMTLRPWAFGAVLARNLMLILWAATMFRSAISRAPRQLPLHVDTTHPGPAHS
jgi:hypothetical protein